MDWVGIENLDVGGAQQLSSTAQLSEQHDTATLMLQQAWITISPLCVPVPAGDPARCGRYK